MNRPTCPRAAVRMKILLLSALAPLILLWDLFLFDIPLGKPGQFAYPLESESRLTSGTDAPPRMFH